jgi:hypothetical protein
VAAFPRLKFKKRFTSLVVEDCHRKPIELDSDAMYQAVVRKMIADMDLLERELPNG